MQSEPARNGQPATEEDADLKLAFERSMPTFTSVNVDAVLSEARFASKGVGFSASPHENVTTGRDSRLTSRDSTPQWRNIMWKSLGAAGVIAASICLALVFGPWGGNSVLAQVQNAIKSVKTATYTVTQSVGGDSATTYKVQLFGDNLCRCHLPNGTYIVLDIRAKKIMQVFPSERRAEIREDLPVPEGFNILAKLANPNSIAVKDQPVVPEREINGIKATGFAIAENGVRYNVWIDPTTKLPLEMERVRTEAEANQPEVKEKWTDFQFGVVLDKALFVLEVPKGFTVETRKAPAGGEKAAEEDRKRAEKAKEMEEAAIKAKGK